MPAAVVPPGEVTIARRASGPSSDSASRVAEPRSVCTTSVVATSGGRPLRDARLDQRLHDEEHVGRSRAGQTRHCVEQTFGHPHDFADGTEDRLGPGEIVFTGVGASRDG